MDKYRLAIIGAGELGQQFLHYALVEGKYKIVGFFDDTLKVGEMVNGYPILGDLNQAVGLYNKEYDCILIAIGYKHLEFKKNIFNELKSKVKFGSIFAPNSYIDETAKIGEGVVIYPGCIIDKNVTINDNVVLNIGSVVSHDSIVGSHSFVAPRASIAGFSIIGEKCFLGINSTIIDRLNIADDTIIAGGAVVVKNIDKSGVYVGVPAKFIK